MTESYWKWVNSGLKRFFKVPFFKYMIILLLIYVPIVYQLNDDFLINISIVIFAIICSIIFSYQIYFEDKKKKRSS